MKIFTIDQLKNAIDLDKDLPSLIKTQREAFIDFSSGLYEVPMPMHLGFPSVHGDCHIKCGYKKENDHFIIKVASGFYENGRFGLPSNDGVVLVFSQKFGSLLAILMDGGWLTTLRTALAALIAASITPWKIETIGLIGTGALAVLTQDLIKKQYSDRQLCLWGRDIKKLDAISSPGVHKATSLEQLLARSDLIITTTASTSPLIKDNAIFGKKHIIALGADDINKQECDPALFGRADTIIVDSLLQAQKFGDAYHALATNIIKIDQMVELGQILDRSIKPDAELLITSLTGIAAQDIAIYEHAISA